jgi:hypothetical protein
VRAFVVDDLLEVDEVIAGALLVGRAERVVVGDRVHHADEAGGAGFVGEAAGVAGHHHAGVGGPVVAAVAAQDLVAAGEEAGGLDRVLVGLGAAVGEEEGVDVAGDEGGEALAEAGARGGGEARGDEQHLAVDRGLHGREHVGVRVADVDAHELAVEVEVALALGRVEVHALGAFDGDRVDGAALGPRPHRVLLAGVDDLLAVHLAGAVRAVRAVHGN